METLRYSLQSQRESTSYSVERDGGFTCTLWLIPVFLFTGHVVRGNVYFEYKSTVIDP